MKALFFGISPYKMGANLKLGCGWYLYHIDYDDIQGLRFDAFVINPNEPIDVELYRRALPGLINKENIFDLNGNRVRPRFYGILDLTRGVIRDVE